MTRRYNSKAITWGVVAILIAAAFLLARVSLGGAAEGEVIDMAAPVSSAQCSPCHANLGSVDIPGVTFSHGNHLLVSCDSCHSRMPHQGGAAEHIPMEACFACHGIQHGDQGELATGECEDCHTPAFELRPVNHRDDWAETPHADVARVTGVNDCMMCHEAKADCDTCHADEAPDVGPMPKGYHTVVVRPSPGPSIKIDPDADVAASQCMSCHPDIDDISPGRIIFSHSDHLSRNYSCMACHPRFPHSIAGVERPDMLSCYRCHGLNHAVQGQVATEDCLACHPESFELVPENHTRAFIRGDHTERVNEQPEYCAMCHANSMCVECHTGNNTGPDAPSQPVIPADHRTPTWMAQHGGLFLEGKGACGSCHTQQSCQECHKTPMPHPVGWLSDHKPPPGIENSDCNICHTERSSCQSCHHESVRDGELIAGNCTPCHEEMKERPATGIKHKRFAEHAVHFDVAESKGEPYTCDDCHVGFSTSATQQHQGTSAPGGLAEAGHDVRLCYGCHGALDLQNRLIAPFPGVSLCIRCHTDLHI